MTAEAPEAAAASPAARIQVFWQPGCTSCLRVKEFLTRQGIDFESIDVHGNPAGLSQLAALGARSVPVVALAGRYTLCQSIGDVIRFLDLKTGADEPLPPAELVDKLVLVLDAAARYTRQFTPAQLHQVFRDRNRTPGQTAFHIFRVAEMGLEAAQGIQLRFEGFDDVQPPEWTADDIAEWGLSVRDRLVAWWRSEVDTTLVYLVPTYYGQRTMHDVLERTAWHAAQHTRQVMLMLESHGIQPDRALTREDLAGLPLPEAAWG